MTILFWYKRKNDAVRALKRIHKVIDDGDYSASDTMAYEDKRLFSYFDANDDPNKRVSRDAPRDCPYGIICELKLSVRERSAWLAIMNR